MPDLNILIADDEATFLHATCELLRIEGYSCHAAADAAAAAALCQEEEFDLVIADIKMPGNAGLEFVRELPAYAPGAPVILITGYPTLNTAISALRLTVFDYLCKPLSFDEFLKVIHRAEAQTISMRALRRFQQRLDRWRADAAQLDAHAASAPANPGQATLYTEAFAELACRNLTDAVADLSALARGAARQRGVQDPCRALHCPRLREYSDTLRDAAETLERTRSAFKSKDLARLRKRIEDLLGAANRPYA